MLDSRPPEQGRTLAETVAISLHSSHLEHVDHRETAIDRIGALGKGNRLGRLLFHFREGGVQGAIRPSYQAYVGILRKRFEVRNGEYNILRKLAWQAIEEWMNPNCPRCQGQGASRIKRYENDPENATETVCDLCKGDQVYRHSDYERAAALGIGSKRYFNPARNGLTWDQMMTMALQILRGRDEQVKVTIARQLRGNAKGV